MSIQQRLALPVTPELYEGIRRLWIAHSKAEDGRDLDGLIATLADDCVYELVPTGQRWQGHAGAREFYRTFLGAFPDVHFAMTDIVVGPQGVFEVATMTGTHRGAWLDHAPSGRRVQATVLIHFPWDAGAGKFAGEKVYFDREELLGQLR